MRACTSLYEGSWDKVQSLTFLLILLLVGMGLNPYADLKGVSSCVSRAAAAEFGKDGIRVNAVFPGIIETPMVANPFSLLKPALGGFNQDDTT